jgi:hypothetical protein
MGPPPCEHSLIDLTFFDRMDGYNLHTVKKLVVGDHHLSTAATVDHRHHRDVAKGGVIVIVFGTPLTVVAL